MMKIVNFGIILTFLLSFDVFAARKIKYRDYFASLRASKTNVRAGPGRHYPIKFVFKAKSVPVHVVSEYDNWVEIEDFEGQSGWVNKVLLTKRRSLMVKTTAKFINMYSKKNERSRVLYRLKNHVVGKYLGCEGDWCLIEVKDKEGWVKRGLVFGD